MTVVPLDLQWDGASNWIEAASRPLPARPVLAGEDDDGQRWWVAGIPFENRAALLLIVDVDDCGTATDAVVSLVLPMPGRWEERLEALPCTVANRRIRPTLPCNRWMPEELDWLLTDGWWARLDDAAELHRYAALFGGLPVER